MRLIGTVAGVCVAATVLAGCGGGGGGSGSSDGNGNGDADLLEGGTFTMAMDSDPGNLDPQMSAASNVFQLSAFAYDNLITIDQEGTIGTQLADSWEVDGQEVTLTLRDGITCSDGSPFTAADVAANINFITDPENQSSLLGLYVPAGASATAEGSTVTIALAAPAPFVLQGLANVPMVCASGMQDRSVLAQETRGTGPFELTEVIPSDSFTFTKRDGYDWGPNGATTAEKGMPEQVVVKVVPNQTTAANLLLSGGLNGAVVNGPDADRLRESDLFTVTIPAVFGEMWFNQVAERPGSDPAVRTALTQALDLEQIAKVITSDQGTPGTTFALIPPVACPGNSVADALPTQGLDEAKQTLDDAGWTAGSDGTRSKDGKPLAVTFIYNTGAGTPASAAAELATSAWEELGVTVDTKGQDDATLLNVIFSTGDWDVTWLTLNVSSPDQLVPFMSGPAPPDGNNFAHIDNAEYSQGVEEAMTLQGTEGCDVWLAAEASLVENADVIPFANQVAYVFGSGARFESGSVSIAPTSIRMLAS